MDRKSLETNTHTQNNNNKNSHCKYADGPTSKYFIHVHIICIRV